MTWEWDPRFEVTEDILLMVNVFTYVVGSIGRAAAEARSKRFSRGRYGPPRIKGFPNPAHIAQFDPIPRFSVVARDAGPLFACRLDLPESEPRVTDLNHGISVACDESKNIIKVSVVGLKLGAVSPSPFADSIASLLYDPYQNVTKYEVSLGKGHLKFKNTIVYFFRKLMAPPGGSPKLEWHCWGNPRNWGNPDCYFETEVTLIDLDEAGQPPPPPTYNPPDPNHPDYYPFIERLSAQARHSVMQSRGLN